MAKINDCKLLNLPKIEDSRGNLTFVESTRHVPFTFKRVYYLYDVPGGAERGGHAHKDLQQLIVAASGSFDIVVDDGTKKETFSLNRPNKGLYFPAGLWREINNFSSGATCLVLASCFYQEDDYIRDYKTFKSYKQI